MPHLTQVDRYDPFKGVPTSIPFEGPTSRNPLAFRYYNAEQIVAGKPMKEWLRFAVAFWHTWRGNGADIFGLDGAADRPWPMDNTLEAAYQARPFRAYVLGAADGVVLHKSSLAPFNPIAK